jgi:hypothetical protein
MKVETSARAGGHIDRTVEPDDAAEGGEGVGVAREDVGLGGTGAGCRHRTGWCA